MQDRKLRILLFSTLYPSRVRPGHGIFVETRLKKLLETGEVEARVLAPVPWFPLINDVFGEYARIAATPEAEVLNGIQIDHPRYFLPPKIGMNVAPSLLAHAAIRSGKSIRSQGFDFDLIDAHYLYPDGVAARIFAKWAKKPFVVTARGSDVMQLPDFPVPRRKIIETVKNADACVGVSEDLTKHLVELGAPPEKTRTIRNGVDLDRFHPKDRDYCREVLGLPKDAEIYISIGNLIELKGHHLAIEAVSKRPNAHLIILGDGVMRSTLEKQIRSLDIASRCHLLGRKAQSELSTYLSASNALILASRREGWANVLLEAMACGTPVVATAINGNKEVVKSTVAGELTEQRTVDGILAAISRLMERGVDRLAVRRYAEKFSWDQSSADQIEVFDMALSGFASN